MHRCPIERLQFAFTCWNENNYVQLMEVLVKEGVLHFLYPINHFLSYIYKLNQVIVYAWYSFPHTFPRFNWSVESYKVTLLE